MTAFLLGALFATLVLLVAWRWKTSGLPSPTFGEDTYEHHVVYDLDRMEALLWKWRPDEDEPFATRLLLCRVDGPEWKLCEAKGPWSRRYVEPTGAVGDPSAGRLESLDAWSRGIPVPADHARELERRYQALRRAPARPLRPPPRPR